MNNPLTIAIYSGEIPSTTFIERLIKGLQVKGQKILLFGSVSGDIKYTNSVNIIGYKKNRFSKAYELIKYSLLLSIIRSKEKRALDKWLVSQNKNTLNAKLKFYPVLFHKPDIFHIQWAKSITDWCWVQDFGMKLVVSLRGTHITISPKVNTFWNDTYLDLFSNVNKFHSVSENLATDVLGYGVERQKINVIKSGLDMNAFIYNKKNTIHKPLQIISIGRSHFAKGYTYALDAMFGLKKMGVKFNYTIIGASKDEALVYQRAQLELEDEVILSEALPFVDVQSALLKADVIFLPSVAEGIANVVLEAMALGRLVVSTDSGSMKEVIVPNQTGFLVPNRNVQSMTLALKEVSLLSIEEYQQLTIQARHFVEQFHSESRMISEMQGFYSIVMSKDNQ
ncbi:glycosyltransferase family 4 protein [Gelidibacter sp. F2691]|nr:glycosyltransferase family 4 protein [Gelidibacter sp. F2691]